MPHTATQSSPPPAQHALHTTPAHRLLETFFLLLLPAVSFFALNFQPLHQNHMLDPYIYTGYIQNFHELWARYGVTYYGVRFGIILPGRLFTALLGAEAGYFALRYLLALTFGIPLYVLCKQRLSVPTAVFIYVIALCTPYLPSAILWEYPDATGVPCLSAAVCLFLVKGRPAWFWRVLAGCFLGIAGNSNLFAVGIFGVFVVVYGAVWLVFRRSAAVLLKRLAAAAAGALGVCAAGALYYWHTTGYLNIFSVTLNMARSLSAGGMAQWRTAGIAWTFVLRHVYVPVWLSLCCALAVLSWRRSFHLAVMNCFGMAVTAFYYVHQFLLHSDTLQLFYYFSYAAPAIFVMLAAVYERLRDGARLRPVPFLVISLSATASPWVLAEFNRNPLKPVISALSAGVTLVVPHTRALGAPAFLAFAALAAGAATVWVVIHVRSRPARTRAWAVMGLVLFGLGYDAGFVFYSSMIQPRSIADHSEINVYRVALQLIQAVPKFQQGEAILFWYNNRIGNSINSIQSTYLWGYSKLNGNPPEDPGLPALNPSEITRLRDPAIRYLGLLAESSSELRTGLDALAGHGIAYREVSRRKLASGGYEVYWDLLDLRSR